MGYANTTSGRVFLGKGGEVRIIKTEMMLGQMINVIQTTSTENIEYRGLSEEDAKKLAAPYNATTNPDGLIKTNLGGIKVTVTNAIGASAWFSVFSCRGTVETAQAQRVGDSTLFNVSYTKQSLSCTADGGIVTDI